MTKLEMKGNWNELKGKLKQIGGWLAAHGALRSETWMADEFRLYESTLTAGGSEYAPVVSYPLRP